MTSCSNEASEEDHHGHHGYDHDHDHTHTHPHGDPPLPTSVSQSLNSKIDTSKVSACNLLNSQADLPALFSDSADGPLFCSRFGPELILQIPFTGTVKLFSLLLRAPPAADADTLPPARVRIYRNSPHLDFSTLGGKSPTYECLHPEVSGNTWVEHHLPRRKFAGTTSISVVLDVPSTAAGAAAGATSRVSLYAVEVRGEFAGLRGRVPVGVLYESAARKEDHPTTTATAKSATERNHSLI